MSREVPVRFCEGSGVRFPRSTLLVILVSAHWSQRRLLAAVDKRLREELAKLEVELNEEKSRVVDLAKDETFGFLGFDFRRVRSLRGKWRPNFAPLPKKRKALVGRLKTVFRKHVSQPVTRVIEAINPILRGWVNYFAIGHSSRCFSYVRHWVELKIRRHLARVRKRKGFGWKRWSTPWLHDTLGLFGDYRLRADLRRKALPAR